MKIIKTFESLTRQARYLKSKFILFPKSEMGIKTVEEIIKKYKVSNIEPYMENAFLIETNIDTIESIVSDYPEFFESYSKLDVNFEFAWDKCENIIGLLKNLQDSLGASNGLIPREWNDEIDIIIKELTNMKMD